VAVRITQWRAPEILAKVPRIVDEYGPVIGAQLMAEISKKQFDWPVPTVRKMQPFVPAGLRNIIDTAELFNSQTPAQVTSAPGATTLRIAWRAPYSKEVLEGGFLVGTVRNAYIAPERDWITPALENQPPLQFFKRKWQESAGAQ